MPYQGEDTRYGAYPPMPGQMPGQAYPQPQQGRPGCLGRIQGSLHITLALIALNVICFFIEMLLPGRIVNSLVLSRQALDAGRWWVFFSSMFMHSGFDHIANNMLTLFFLGTQLEPRMNKRDYLVVYLASGVLAGAAFLLTDIVTGEYVSALGASGAIFGLFGADLFIIYRNHMLYGRGDGSLRTEIQLGIAVFLIGENVLYGFMTPGVANSAHVGGLIAGYLLASMIIGKDLSGLRRR